MIQRNGRFINWTIIPSIRFSAVNISTEGLNDQLVMLRLLTVHWNGLLNLVLAVTFILNQMHLMVRRNGSIYALERSSGLFSLPSKIKQINELLYSKSNNRLVKMTVGLFGSNDYNLIWSSSVSPSRTLKLSVFRLYGESFIIWSVVKETGR